MVKVGTRTVDLSRVSDGARLAELHRLLVSGGGGSPGAAEAVRGRMDEIVWEPGKTGKILRVSELRQQAEYRETLTRGELSPAAWEELAGGVGLGGTGFDVAAVAWSLWRASRQARGGNKGWRDFVKKVGVVSLSDGTSLAALPETFDRVRKVLLETDSEQYRFIHACRFQPSAVAVAVPSMLKSGAAMTAPTARLFAEGTGGAEVAHVGKMKQCDVIMGLLELADHPEVRKAVVAFNKPTTTTPRIFESDSHKARACAALEGFASATLPKFASVPPSMVWDAFLVEIVREMAGAGGSGATVLSNSAEQIRRAVVDLMDEAVRVADCRDPRQKEDAAKTDYDILKQISTGSGKDWSIRLRNFYGFSAPRSGVRDRDPRRPPAADAKGQEWKSKKGEGKGGKGGKGLGRREDGNEQLAHRVLVRGVSEEAQGQLEDEGFFLHSAHPEANVKSEVYRELEAAGLSKKAMSCPWWHSQRGCQTPPSECHFSHTVEKKFCYNKGLPHKKNMERLKRLVKENKLSTSSKESKLSFDQAVDKRVKALG